MVTCSKKHHTYIKLDPKIQISIQTLQYVLNYLRLGNRDRHKLVT